MGCPAAVEQLCPAANATESEQRCPEVRVYLQRFVATEPLVFPALMLRQHVARRLAAAVMQLEGDAWNTENVNLMLPALWFGRETGPHAQNKEKRAEDIDIREYIDCSLARPACLVLFE
jgi:hypothetical protein